MIIEVDYDETIMYANDKVAKEWFFKEVLPKELILHSNELGDEIGFARIVKIISNKKIKNNPERL